MHLIKMSSFCCLFLFYSLVASVQSCTCFLFETEEGPIFGANLDLFIPGDGYVFINQRGIEKEGFQASTKGEVAKWVSYYGSVTFNLAGREFAFGGMNEAGLVVGSMELLASEFPEPDERPGLTIGSWAQYVLDTCSNVEEVIQLDKKYRIEDSAPPVHFLIADATGNCAALEWFDGEFVCYTGEDLKTKAMSNMRYDRAQSALEMGGPWWWWSNPGQSAERFAAAHERNEGYDPTQEPDTIKYAFDTLTTIVGAPHTKWNIVYNLAKREVWFRSVESPNVKHIALMDFDLSCDAPLLMLNVNSTVEENIKQAFQPYNYDLNMVVFRTLCERYGLDISNEDTNTIMQLFDSFECAK